MTAAEVGPHRERDAGESPEAVACGWHKVIGVGHSVGASPV